MRNGLQMETGPRFLKPVILGAVVIAFGAVTYTMMSGEDSQPKAATTAAADTTAAQPADQMAANTAADPSMATPSEATPGAPDSMAAAPAANAAQATTAATDHSADAAQTASAAPAGAGQIAAPAQVSDQPDPMAAANSSAAATPAAKTAATPKSTAASEASTAMSERSTEAAASSEAASKPEPAKESREVADAKPAAKHSSAKPKMLRQQPPAAEALRAWWQTPESPQRLGVEYVGQAADQKSLVIRFDQQVTDPVAAENIKLVTSSGEQVAANWQAGEDPRVLVAPNLEPGRYTVLIGPQLASIQGQSLGTELHGPAFIQ